MNDIRLVIPFTHFADSGELTAWAGIALSLVGMYYFDKKNNIGIRTFLLLPMGVFALCLLVVQSDNGQLAHHMAPNFITNVVASGILCVLAACTFSVAWFVAWDRRLSSRLVRCFWASVLAFTTSLFGALAMNLWLYADWKVNYPAFTPIVEGALLVSLLFSGLFTVLAIMLWSLGYAFRCSLDPIWQLSQEERRAR